MTGSGAPTRGRAPVASGRSAPGGDLDGRSARRDRNRTAVLDAAIELFAEGNLQPSPSDVAARCGVSHRSINRYFPDNRALLRAAVDRQIEIGIPLFKIHAIGKGPLVDRIDEFVRVRLAAFEELGATARAASYLSATSRIVRTEMEAVRALLTDQVDRQFATELSALPEARREASRTAVDALFQFESLDYYRRLRGLDQVNAHELLARATGDLLVPGSFDPGA